MALRGFEVVADWARKVPGQDVVLPQRATQHSAAYDIFALENKVIYPGGRETFHTDVKAYMQPNEVLLLFPRSSQGIKLNLMLANTTGVIDADYYSNPQNDGSFSIVLRNMGGAPVEVRIGDRIAQAMFTSYLLADNEPQDLPSRQGGVGSTGK